MNVRRHRELNKLIKCSNTLNNVDKLFIEFCYLGQLGLPIKVSPMLKQYSRPTLK